MGACRILRDRRGRFLTLFERAIAQALADTSELCQQEAYSLAPKKSGDLANSIRSNRVGDFHWMVGVYVAYAAYVELGTRYQQGQPYLLPAFLLARRFLMEVLSRRVRVTGENVNGAGIIARGTVD